MGLVCCYIFSNKYENTEAHPLKVISHIKKCVTLRERHRLIERSELLYSEGQKEQPVRKDSTERL